MAISEPFAVEMTMRAGGRRSAQADAGADPVERSCGSGVPLQQLDYMVVSEQAEDGRKLI